MQAPDCDRGLEVNNCLIEIEPEGEESQPMETPVPTEGMEAKTPLVEDERVEEGRKEVDITYTEIKPRTEKEQEFLKTFFVDDAKAGMDVIGEPAVAEINLIKPKNLSKIPPKMEYRDDDLVLPEAVEGPPRMQEVIEDSEDDNQGEVGNAPKLNREDLENFFKVCPSSVMAKFRLVCTEWSECSVKAWRQESILRVGGDSEEKRGIKQKDINLQELIRRTEDENDSLKLSLGKRKAYQYRRYKLVRWYLIWENPYMVKFWNYFSVNITYLELFKLRVDKPDTLMEVLYGKLPNCVTLVLDRISGPTILNQPPPPVANSLYPPQMNLRTLKVRNLTLWSCPIVWIDFFRQFPKIQNLESFNTSSDDVLIQIVGAIRTIRLDNSDHLPIKSLSIIRCDDKKHAVPYKLSLARLQACDFQLEQAHFKLGCRSKEAAKKILGTWSATLKKLKYHIDFKSEGQELKYKLRFFPYIYMFPVLEELEVAIWCRPYPCVMDILLAAPNLKSLVLSGIARPEIWGYNRNLLPLETRVGDFKHLALKELTYTFKTFANFSSLPLLAPNLTKLDTRLDNVMFRLVCKQLPNLMELRTNSPGEEKMLTDEGITGILDTPKPGPSSEIVAVLPNITWLKELRVFDLRDREHRLTDKSVFLGFLLVPKLITLGLTLIPGKITDDARQALERSIQNLIIHPSPLTVLAGNENQIAA